jgi:hypothetical protein
MYCARCFLCLVASFAMTGSLKDEHEAEGHPIVGERRTNACIAHVLSLFW